MHPTTYFGKYGTIGDMPFSCDTQWMRAKVHTLNEGDDNETQPAGTSRVGGNNNETQPADT
jgi:hypothetical protein